MTGEFIVIGANGSVKREPLTATPDYPKLKAALNGGMLEVVPHWTAFGTRRCVVFCDEEGKLHDLPRNHLATGLWYVDCPEARGVDYLVGPIVIVAGDDDLLALL